MNLIENIFAADSDATFKGDFLRALANSDVQAALLRVQNARVALAKVERLALVHDALLRAMCDGASPATLLNETAIELQKHVAEARANNEALNVAVTAAGASVAHALPKILSERLELPVEIAAIERRVRGFDKARDDYRERLVEAGLDPRTIAAIEPVPTHFDLEAWQAAIADKRARFERIDAFVKSGPFFAPTLLGEDLAASFAL